MPDIPSGPKGGIMTLCTICALVWALSNSSTLLGALFGVPVVGLVTWGVSAFICDVLGIPD